MNCEVININHGEVEYRSIGTGRPIVFIHGGHSNCHETLSHKGFDLEKFQLITPSRPGYGKTPLSNNQTPSKAASLLADLLIKYHLNRQSNNLWHFIRWIDRHRNGCKAP